MHITSGVMDMTKLKRGKYSAKKRSLMYQPTVGEELRVVEPDQNIRTEPEESKRRRTIILHKENDSWGFTVHTYGIHHKTSDKLEILTYVDYVSPNGPAYVAGMRAGDVILAINGLSMEAADHDSLVNFIKTCDMTMRMIVLFEDCCQKVELHSRFIKLQRVLRAKVFELRSLEHQEALVLEGKSRVDIRRLSLASTSSSSMNGFWDDRLSLRPEYDICPMHGTSPVLPKHNSGDNCSLRMASPSSVSLCSCEFGNVLFTPTGRLDSHGTLRSSFGCYSLGSGRRPPDLSFLRNTASLDRHPESSFLRNTASLDRHPDLSFLRNTANLDRHPESSFLRNTTSLDRHPESSSLKNTASLDRHPESSFLRNTTSLDRHPDSSFLRNTASLDRADFNRQKRPRSLNLNRPISSYDLKFPAIEELELKTYNAANAVPSVLERVQAKSGLSRTSVYSSFHSDVGSTRKPLAISPLAGVDITQKNTSEIHRSSTDPGNRCGTMASSKGTSKAGKSRKKEYLNLAIGGTIGSGFTRSLIYHSAPHRLRKSSKLKRSSSHISEFKGSPMLLSIKPLKTYLPLSSPGGSTDSAKDLSCTASNCLRYSRNFNSRTNNDDELSLTDSPMTDNVFPSPSHPFPGPVASTPLPRNQNPSSDASQSLALNLGEVTSQSAISSASYRCNGSVSPCDLCNRGEATVLRRDPRECSGSRRDTSDYYSMVPSVLGDTDNWFLAGATGCDDGCDCFMNNCSPQKQQKQFVFYNDLNCVQLEFVNEKDEETAL